MTKSKRLANCSAAGIDRIETSVTDNGQCLIAYRLDGSGQKIFYSLDEVEQHIAEHPAIAITLSIATSPLPPTQSPARPEYVSFLDWLSLKVRCERVRRYKPPL